MQVFNYVFKNVIRQVFCIVLQMYKQPKNLYAAQYNPDITHSIHNELYLPSGELT